MNHTLLAVGRDVFFEIIKFLDYKDIVRLCNLAREFRSFCNDKKVWNYLLRRDFFPLLDEDIILLNNKDITPKELYYRIQETDIRQAIEFYNQYDFGPLIELVKLEKENYYGAMWLIKTQNF